MNYIVRVITMLTFLILPLGISAQWNSFIINYKKDVFGRGAQTWQIRAYDENHLFCANKNGVLQYNGNDWQLYPFHNGSHVRSIHFSEKQKRVYAGGESEFGYLEPDEAGEMIYTVLSDRFNEQYSLYGGYWGVFEVDNLVYYVSDKHVVKQIGDTFTAIESEFKIDCSAVVNGILHVGTVNGIWMLVGNTWLSAPGGEMVKDKTIRSIVPFGKGYLAATAFDGLYYGNERGIEPFQTGGEEFMQQNEIFSLAASKDYIAIGSIHKGLLLYNIHTERLQYYNDQNGLQNNTVLSICFDKQDNLWVGLDNGIDYISLHPSLTNLYTSPYSKGSGYASLIHEDVLYLGTNRGLFYTEWPVRMGEDAVNPQLIPELSGQVWGLERVGDEIFCLHDKGLYRIRGNKAEVIPGLRGALICHPFESSPDLCWIGSYEGLFLLEKKDGQWNIRQSVDDIATWMKDVRFESQDVLWVRNNEDGFTRIQLEKDPLRRGKSEQFNESNGLDTLRGIYLHTVFGEIRLSSLSGIYKYEASNRKIVKDEILNGCLLPGKEYTQLVTTDSTLFALSPGMIQTVHFSDGKPVETRRFSFDPSQIEPVRAFEALITVDNSRAIIPNEFGFALLNTDLSATDTRKELFIRNVFISYPKDSLVYTDNIAGMKTLPQIPFRFNSVRFEYAIRSFGQSWPVMYRYRLLPDVLWSELTPAIVKEYGNLEEGDYTFEVEAFFPDGDQTRESYNFTIRPPWYWTIYAIIGYIFIFLFGLYLLYKVENSRIARKKRAVLQEKEEEMLLKEQAYTEDRLLKEQEIMELRNEKLMQELNHKSQEMANLMINFTRKNEILIEIKQELSRIASEMKGESSVKTKRMLLTLNNSIDSNIASDDALKRFEEQFDLVHNNFMKKVREKHGDLTTSEIKMCAYVRMGLTSKEMAPLLNISVRGVETLRYRLRKKMNLDREASLTEYLGTFS